MYDLMVIGGGPAGLAAGVYAARKQLKTLLISGDIGGQINTTWGIENYLGYQFIEGPELISKFETQVDQFPIDQKIGDRVRQLKKVKGGFTATTEAGKRYQSRAVVFTTGKRPRKLNVPGETELTIRKTIDLAKALPLDLALFHIAAPHPGTPFFFEVVENGWFRQGARWEEVDMDRSTALEYPQLSAIELQGWARKAFREWALRPGPLVTFLRMLTSSPSLVRSALSVGAESLGWAKWR